MPNKLTDAEVKKALECCASVDDGCSIDCPLYGGDDSCFSTLLKPTLDLINRQTTRLRKVEHQLDDALKMGEIINAENVSLKAEVERLKNAYKQCAWERDIFAEDMTQEIKKDCSYLMLDIKTIKAEAYKEFAEWLKKIAIDVGSVTMEIEVDNLLNELVGDDR